MQIVKQILYRVCHFLFPPFFSLSSSAYFYERFRLKRSFNIPSSLLPAQSLKMKSCKGKQKRKETLRKAKKTPTTHLLTFWVAIWFAILRLSRAGRAVPCFDCEPVGRVGDFPKPKRVEQVDPHQITSHLQRCFQRRQLGAINFLPVDCDFTDGHAKLLCNVEKLDIERPAVQMDRCEQRQRRLPGEEFKALMIEILRHGSA